MPNQTSPYHANLVTLKEVIKAPLYMRGYWLDNYIIYVIIIIEVVMTIKKTLSISLELYEFLKNQGKKGESFDSILKRLLSHMIPNQTKEK